MRCGHRAVLSCEHALAEALVKAGADPLALCDPAALLAPPKAAPKGAVTAGSPEPPALARLQSALRVLLGEAEAARVWAAAQEPGSAFISPFNLVLLYMVEVRAGLAPKVCAIEASQSLLSSTPLAGWCHLLPEYVDNGQKTGAIKCVCGSQAVQKSDDGTAETAGDIPDLLTLLDDMCITLKGPPSSDLNQVCCTKNQPI